MLKAKSLSNLRGAIILIFDRGVMSIVFPALATSCVYVGAHTRSKH
jgi:hypothetical protein